jgi:hypothetical protein
MTNDEIRMTKQRPGESFWFAGLFWFREPALRKAHGAAVG